VSAEVCKIDCAAATKRASKARGLPFEEQTVIIIIIII